MWGWHASISKFSFRPTIAKQPEISCVPCYTCPYMASVKSLSGNIPKAILQHSSAQPLQDPGNNYQIPWCTCFTAARTDSYHVSYTQPHYTTYHNVLWVQVIAEGAIIKVDLVESLLCKADHFTLIEATILVLTDDYLSRGQILECSLSSLRREKSLLIQ